MIPNFIIQSTAIFLAAASATWAVFMLIGSIRIENPASRRLREFQGDIGQPNRQAEIGERVGGVLPISIPKWQNHLEWAQRGGYYPGQKLGGIFFNACLYAAGASLIVLVRPVPVFFLLPVLAFIFPLFAMRSKANAVRKKAVRGLPEMASLVAAEVSAGTPPDQAVLRAAELPGPLSGLLSEAVSHARQTGRPLFSRKPVAGALVEVFSGTRLPALRAFAMQIDEVAGKGVDSAALMNDAARSLAREYRERVMTEKEKLGGRLTSLVAFHFFFPAVLLILMAFLLPMIAMFK